MLEDKYAMEKNTLLEDVKKECKKLMEEAVTKKFVHTDSSCVTSLCGMVELCLLYKLKKRAGGLLPAMNTSDFILIRLSKSCDTAELVAKLCSDLSNEGKEKMSHVTMNGNDSHAPIENNRTLSGYTSTGINTKYLWIRVALLEKCLPTIVTSLIEHWRDFYEPDALIADQVLGPLFVSLLDGPSSLDFSKMKTPDCLYNDPSAHELVQRHKIYSSPSMSHSLKMSVPKGRRLFSANSLRDNPELLGVPSLAREHVESLHQNQISTLLYGKNNVVLSLADFHTPIQGYLSLHKLIDSLLLKWTPNPMLHTSNGPIITEKSQFWGQVITIDLVDVVYIHCHDAGDSGGSVVLVSQDGGQLPPLSFPTSGSLYTFLTCLDQGLNPDGQLDPPLFNKGNLFIKWPRLRKNMFSGKLIDSQKDSEEKATQDFVFRIVNKASSSSIDKVELKKLLSINTSPRKLNPLLSKSNTQTSTLIPKLHTGARLQRKNSVPSRVALNLACEKMKHQILSRAFNGWISSYRHLKTVRTHLASLVLQWSGDDTLPNNVKQGLTVDVWNDISTAGLREHAQTVKQYIYFGGIDPSIRKEVWPYLLGHYSFSFTEQQKTEFQQTASQKYYDILKECKCLEQILQEKEKDLLALNGFANGETFGNVDMDTESVNLDMTDNCSYNDTLDNISQDVSVSSVVSDQFVSDKFSVDNEDKNEPFSLIKSLLETRENLREMVEKASERGVSTWKKLVQKKKKQESKKKNTEDKFKLSETFDGLHQSFVPPTESFDLELDCQKCGKKIIESRQSVVDGKLNDTSIETVECFSCVQERKLNSSYEQDVSPYKMGASPSSVVFNEALTDGSDYAVINGIGTPLKKRTSISSENSAYSEDIMKDFALNIHRIDKDVLRCDRNHPYFESEKNLEKLRNIIMSYVWESLSIGYIQGMCDLCAPLLIVMDDEAEVYGCFLKLMDKMSNNFPHGNAMDLHLSNISSLIQILDPELHEILEGHGDCTIFYFCYRWFLLDFKRELQYEDIYLVWESIWAATSLTSEHFTLFVALAIIELYREIIIDNKMDFTDIIKFFNEMVEQHDARATLKLARNIVQKLQDIMHPGDSSQMEE